jgi:uncharacterized membrane protein
MVLLLSRVVLSLIFLTAGVMHFVHPGEFIRIVPPVLPRPDLLVAISGVCEILGAIGLQVPATRVWAAWGLIALLIAVFPANIYMATSGMRFGSAPVGFTWFRLVFQPLLIAWVYLFTRV